MKIMLMFSNNGEKTEVIYVMQIRGVFEIDTRNFFNDMS